MAPQLRAKMEPKSTPISPQEHPKATLIDLELKMIHNCSLDVAKDLPERPKPQYSELLGPLGRHSEPQSARPHSAKLVRCDWGDERTVNKYIQMLAVKTVLPRADC